MQRKAYVSGVAALLAALLAGCAGSGSEDEADSSKPGQSSTRAAAAEPGRYRTLPEPCGAIEQDALDSLLPGMEQVTDEKQREKAYAGTATLTYDTDRKVGCRWKVDSTSAADHLWVDFERVVSYDNSVSDDSRASQIYVTKQEAADLPAPSESASAGSAGSSEGSDEDSAGAGSRRTPDKSGTSEDSHDGSGKGNSEDRDSSASLTGDEGATSSTTSTPTALQPRTLDGLGDEAFLDYALSGSQQRTVTVVFRTSNVIVTIQYDEQPTSTTDTPGSKEMQDRVRKLADQLAVTFEE